MYIVSNLDALVNKKGGASIVVVEHWRDKHGILNMDPHPHTKWIRKMPNIAYNHIITKMPCGLKMEVDFVMKKNLPVEICGKISRQTDDFNCGAFMCMDFLQMMRFVNSGEGGLLALQEYRGTFVQV